MCQGVNKGFLKKKSKFSIRIANINDGQKLAEKGNFILGSQKIKENKSGPEMHCTQEVLNFIIFTVVSTYHDGDVMSVLKWERTIFPKQVVGGFQVDV